MKITKLYIHDFQQFREFELDFTDPKTGLPLEKVCLIGRNGTGKSTLLSLISHSMHGIPIRSPLTVPNCYGIQVVHCGFSSWLSGKFDGTRIILLSTSDDAIEGHLRSGLPPELFYQWGKPRTEGQPIELLNALIYCPPDDPVQLTDLPSTQLNNALQLFNNFPIYQEVGGRASANFWNLLIYHIKKRDSDWQEFLNLPDNSSRTVAQVQNQFDQYHPEMLKFLAEKWDSILAPAGLVFDYENAKKPIQLTDNLEAYVKLVSGRVRLNYGALSTGIRNYLFKIGHIAALYFGRQVDNGFLLVDEPENSLYPDFLYDLISNYLSVIHNTQLFVATHNPIIAAQFKPEERFILDFDEEHKVTVRRGITPEGDDPNDILEKDFSVRSLYGPEGIRNWEHFLDLRNKIQTEPDATKKKELMREFMSIGNNYNFALKNAVPEKAS